MPEADRMALIERDAALVEQRVGELERDVKDLQPLTVRHAELRLGLRTLTAAVDDLKVNVGKAVTTLQGDVGSIRKDLKDRDDQADRDRRGLRNVLIGLTGAIVVAIIGALGTLVAAGGHP